MRRFDLKKLSDVQLEAAVKELERRRKATAQADGVKLQDVNYDDAIAPSVEFKTPYGQLVMYESRDDGGYRAFLDGERLSMELLEEDDVIDWSLDDKLEEDIGTVVNSPSHALMAWRCASFVKKHEKLLKHAMVKKIQE